MDKRYHNRAQSTVEYAMLIACIAAALIAMQIYVKRSIQGRAKDAADQIGEQYSSKTTRSSLTQTITNPDPVTITGKPVFVPVVNPDTGKTENREIMEVTRHETTNIAISDGSYEETGKLSDEKLFD
ncbi:MAG: hypothetical protein WC301_06540 [Candidatus Omnitrophota bacterium]|jgi:Flp pilus assembly pilin Flp